MDYDKVDFPIAVETLAKDAGLDVPQEKSQTQQTKTKIDSSLYDVLSEANHYYQIQLRKHPQKQAVVNYLKNRGLTGKVAAKFSIGFAPPGWQNLLKALGTEKDKRKLLLEAGLTLARNKDRSQSKSQGRGSDHDFYDRFRDRIMFPIRDSRGRVIAFGGRVL